MARAIHRWWTAGLLTLGSGVTSAALAATPEPYAVLADPAAPYQWFHGLVPGTSVGVPVAYFSTRPSDSEAAALWRTDVTPEGTHGAAVPTLAGQVSRWRVPADGGAYFIAPDGEGIRQVHWTDGSGSATSTRRLTADAAGVEAMTGMIGDRPLFARVTSEGAALWRIDDTFGAISPMIELPSRFDRIPEWVLGPRGGLAMWVPSSGSGYRVTHFGWDGAPSIELPAPLPAPSWNYPHAGGAADGLFCMKAYTSEGARLHCTDGTVEGTRRPVAPSLGTDVWIPDFVEFKAIGDRLLFITHAQSGPYRPWITDGTNEGTYALLDKGPSSMDVCTEGSAGELYFTGPDTDGAIGLWRTDGTRPGTRKLATVSGPCSHRGIARALDGRAYIAAGDTLYSSDATSAGTRTVVGAPALHWESGETGHQGVVMLGRWLVFAAPDGKGGASLWRLDLDPVFVGDFD